MGNSGWLECFSFGCAHARCALSQKPAGAARWQPKICSRERLGLALLAGGRAGTNFAVVVAISGAASHIAANRRQTAHEITARGALAEHLRGSIEGDGDVEVSGVAPIARAGANDVTFAESARSCEEAFASTAECVILVRPGAATSSQALSPGGELPGRPLPRSWPFSTSQNKAAGIDSSARIATGVQLGEGVHIGPNVDFGRGRAGGRPHGRFFAELRPRGRCRAGRGLPASAEHHPLFQRELGSRVIIHSGTVIGADGFGYARKASGIAKIPQIGGVVIEDDVEIGAIFQLIARR